MPFHKFDKIGIVLLCTSWSILAQWTPTDGPYGASINALGVDGTTIIAGTNLGGVYLSEDGGNTWHTINNGMKNKSVRAVMAADGVLFAGIANILGTGTIVRSNDNGNSWMDVFSGRNSNAVYNFLEVGSMLFATLYGAGIFRSADTGQTWTGINEGLPNFSADPIVEHKGNLYAGVGQDVYCSSDSGASWQQLSTGKVNSRISALAVAADTITVGSFSFGLFTLVRADTIWTYTDSALTGMHITRLLYAGGKLFAGTDRNGMFVSSDRGISWSTFNNESINSRISALAVNKDSLIAGTEKGVYMSSWNSPAWKPTNTGFSNTGVIKIAVSGDTLIAATYLNGIQRSPDNGGSWAAVNDGLPDAIFTDVFFYGGILYAGSLGRGLYRSNDYGESWKQVTALPDTIEVRFIFTSNEFLVVMTMDGVIYRSTDNGGTWRKVVQYAISGKLNSYYVDDSIIFIGNIYGTLARSTDCGLTWKRMQADSIKTNVSAITGVGGRVIAGTIGFGIFYSDDNGITWQQIYKNPVGRYTGFVSTAKIGDTIFAASEGGSMYRTTDAGETWETTKSIGCDVYGIFPDIKNETIFAGTVGNGVWRCAVKELNESATVKHTEGLSVTAKTTAFRVVERGGRTSIIISPPPVKSVQLELFKIDGRRVAYTSVGTVTSKCLSVSLNTAVLPTGYYTARLLLDSSCHNVPVIITHRY